MPTKKSFSTVAIPFATSPIWQTCDMYARLNHGALLAASEVIASALATRHCTLSSVRNANVNGTQSKWVARGDSLTGRQCTSGK